MARGGYRKPRNPAPVSGPASMSRRTDGGPSDPQPLRSLPGGAYGEGKEFKEIQKGAPMPTAPAPGGGMSPPPSLFAPTQKPDEPYTSGAAAGEGSNITPKQRQRRRSLAEVMETAATRDTTGYYLRMADFARRLGL